MSFFCESIINLKKYLWSRARWFNLTLLLIPLILVLTFIFHEKHALIYTPISWAIASFILFVNFPDLLLSLHSRPLYYDDLVIQDYNDGEATDLYDNNFRKKYQNIFRWIVTITSSIMVALIVEIWYFKDDYFPDNDKSNGVVTWTVVLSIIGGLSKIYYVCSLGIGKIIMWALKYFKQRDIDNQRKILQEEVELVVTDSGVRLVMENDDNNDRVLNRSLSHNAIRIIALKPNVMADIFNT